MPEEDGGTWGSGCCSQAGPLRPATGQMPGSHTSWHGQWGRGMGQAGVSQPQHPLQPLSGEAGPWPAGMMEQMILLVGGERQRRVAMETSYVILRRHGGIRTHPSRMNPSSGRRGVWGGGDRHPLKSRVGWLVPSSATPCGSRQQGCRQGCLPRACPGGQHPSGTAGSNWWHWGRVTLLPAQPEQAIGNSLQGAEVNTCGPPPIFLRWPHVGRSCERRPRGRGEVQGEGSNILAFWII